MSLLVFGHKNPDTDSICSSIALSYLKNQLGFEAKPYALGEVRKEAQFALDYFKVSAPELLTDVKGKDVILVDHNELAQTADGIEEANIVEIVVDNEIAAKDFTALIPELQDYLRGRLKNSKVVMTVRVSAPTETVRAVGRVEKFQMMSQKNQALMQLKEEFGLELY